MTSGSAFNLFESVAFAAILATLLISWNRDRHDELVIGPIRVTVYQASVALAVVAFVFTAAAIFAFFFLRSREKRALRKPN